MAVGSIAIEKSRAVEKSFMADGPIAVDKSFMAKPADCLFSFLQVPSPARRSSPSRGDGDGDFNSEGLSKRVMAPMLQHLFNLSPMLQDFLTRMRNMTRALHPLRRHRAHPHRQSSAEECCSCDDEEEEEKRSKTTHHKQQEIQQDLLGKILGWELVGFERENSCRY
ncbi:hypothetical protein SUGI_0632380 [Cryptomeria japonica]|nr:hypothetical protein SUGI_0632380 [Cryptomeria japonica]